MPPLPRMMTRTAHPRRAWGLLAGVASLGFGTLVWWHGLTPPLWGRGDAARFHAAIARARAELQSGRPGHAMRAVAEVPETGPWAAELLTVKGLAQAAFGRPDQVRALLERSLLLDPKQPMALKTLAAVDFSDNEVDRGLDRLAQAAALDPGDFRPWYAGGEILLRIGGRAAQAVMTFREAVRRNPDHRESRLGLAEALLGTGESEESGRLLEEILRDQPQERRALRLAARRAWLEGDADATLRYADAALSLDSGDVDALLLRAQTHLQAGRGSEALVDAELAAMRTPDNPAALALAAQAAGLLGSKEKASSYAARHGTVLERSARVERYRNLVKVRPGDIEPRWRLGQAALEAGLSSLARRSFQSALELDPTCGPAHRGLESLNAAVRPTQ
jgi:cytochrome c-type biogenesis protein CcmH/NrfG